MVEIELFIRQRFGLNLKFWPLPDENYVDAAAKIVVEIIYSRPVDLFSRLHETGHAYIAQGIIYCCSPGSDRSCYSEAIQNNQKWQSYFSERCRFKDSHIHIMIISAESRLSQFSKKGKLPKTALR